MRRRSSRSIFLRAGLAVAVATVCTAGTAHAQSTYIGAAAAADIVRFGTAAGIGGGPSGEAFGGSVRIGTSITDRWGLDLEFARPGEIDHQSSPGLLRVMSAATVRQAPGGPGGMIAAPGMPGRAQPFPGGGAFFNIQAPRIAQITTTQRFSTLTAMPWIRQSLGSRADIVYLGGIAFVRTERAISSGGRGDQTAIAYGAAPAVGVDVRVSMTDHLRFVPGMRLLVVDAGGRSGWITRPSLGLQWTF